MNAVFYIIYPIFLVISLIFGYWLHKLFKLTKECFKAEKKDTDSENDWYKNARYFQ